MVDTLQRETRRAFLFALIFVMVCVAIVILMARNSEAATIIVDAGGNGDYSSIQTAITNANINDTIRVWAGTYSETITIDKPLHLIGNGSSNTTIYYDGSADPGSSTVWINANYTTIEGFNITIYPGSFPTPTCLKLNSNPVHHITIRNNLFFTSVSPGAYEGGGIVLEQVGITHFYDISIENNTFERGGKGIYLVAVDDTGTVVTGYGENITIQNNTVDWVSIYVVWVSNGTNIHILNNTIKNTTYQGHGMDLSRLSNSTISYNDLSNNYYGMMLTWVNDTIISYNDLRNSTNQSFVVTDCYNLTWLGNTVDGSLYSEFKGGNALVEGKIDTKQIVLNQTTIQSTTDAEIIGDDTKIVDEVHLIGVSIGTIYTNLTIENATLYLLDCSIQPHVNTSAQYRAFNPSIRFINSTIYINSTTFYPHPLSLYAENTVIYLNDTTLTRTMSTHILLNASTLHMTRATISGDGTTTLISAIHSTINIDVSTLSNGYVALRNTTATITQSTLSSAVFCTENANLTLYNTSSTDTRWYVADTVVYAKNTPLDKTKITIYRNSSFHQLWLVHLKTEPLVDVWFSDLHFNSTATGQIHFYAEQWDYNSTGFYDHTVHNATAEGVNSMTVYLTNEMWVNLTKVPDVVEYRLHRGWNTIGTSYDIQGTIADILIKLGDGSRAVYRDSNGVYHYVVYRNKQIFGENFAIRPHMGLIIYSPYETILFAQTEVGTKITILFGEGWNLVAMPGEVQITVKEFFNQNPHVIKIYYEYNGTTYYFTPTTADDTTLPHNTGIYVYCETDGEWYWQDNL